MRNQIQEAYTRLYEHFGPQQWWPAETPFEVIVGAILTQNTAWTNVEKAIANLKREGLLQAKAMQRARVARLARLVRPSGYYNLKAKKLKAFIAHLYRRGGGALEELFVGETAALREELLAVYGIGPETADSILLYAANRPVFVIDAYTRRIAARLGWCDENVTYDELQTLFTQGLAQDVQTFNEYHALLVMLGKEYCRKRDPRCAGCPLRSMCRVGKARGKTIEKGPRRRVAQEALDRES